MASPRRYARRSGLMEEIYDAAVFLLDDVEGKIHALDDLTGFVWLLLEEERTFDELLLAVTDAANTATAATTATAANTAGRNKARFRLDQAVDAMARRDLISVITDELAF